MPKTKTKKSSSGRRLAATGYSRGEETRLRIIQAAVELFGDKGYDQTSTREIAARAGVNAPVLQYYFQGKEGLYLACAEHMAERGRTLLAPTLEEIRRRMAAQPSTAELIECVCLLLDHLTHFIMMKAEVDRWARFMAWEDLHPDRAPASARAVIDRSFKQSLNSLMRDLVGRITGKRPDDPRTGIRVITLFSQVSVFHATRGRAMQIIGWKELDAKGLALIKAVIREQTVATLSAAAKKAR
jgi:AcrR family transcriptional regulator